MSALIVPVAISPQYECVHVIPRTPMFAPVGQIPFERAGSDPASVRLAGKHVRVGVPFEAPG